MFLDAKCPDIQRGEIKCGGAGSYIIKGFKSLDFYAEHYYSNINYFLKHRVEYDVRGGYIPYSNGSVDNIYKPRCRAHRSIFVEKFINEAFRALKAGGVLRIARPDAKFLYTVSQFSNEC